MLEGIFFLILSLHDDSNFEKIVFVLQLLSCSQAMLLVYVYTANFL